MAARYPGAIFNHLAFVGSRDLRGAREVAGGIILRGKSHREPRRICGAARGESGAILGIAGYN